MAVDFPGDLIADVARAADNRTVEQARARLAGLAEASGRTAQAFTNELKGTAAAIPAITAMAGEPPAEQVAVVGKNQDPAMQRFEAMMLQQMIQQMMPKETSAVYGEGFAGDMWRSMQAEKIGETFAKRGGIGIAEAISSRFALSSGDVRTGTADGAAIVDKITLRMLRQQQSG
ncbi:rod-binding protein [Notoacmeibacter sp. MSK16QG-6]|uniref:rod-binding protein n=1 Tax=Notoacmeibacter sp. MSK16QG-6 TaxID=2957982 RepID=UPI0020A1FC3A|nr:rod-binding protein [Notoacmeibacter sp. MSK16QG-6]MCP1200887.1 rod-binding protein [Notoacmeibacter sp. MSK16QG-6]